MTPATGAWRTLAKDAKTRLGRLVNLAWGDRRACSASTVHEPTED
ncbi:hypothetical protein ACFSWD_21905 [Paenibacillus xanthanilyticus]